MCEIVALVFDLISDGVSVAESGWPPISKAATLPDTDVDLAHIVSKSETD